MTRHDPEALNVSISKRTVVSPDLGIHLPSPYSTPRGALFLLKFLDERLDRDFSHDDGSPSWRYYVRATGPKLTKSGAAHATAIGETVWGRWYGRDSSIHDIPENVRALLVGRDELLRQTSEETR